ncbi:helix-turn-helix domain-containing protein [Nonomuraea sp. MCN248]|uniref:Helix-turn-helix domain-containing protein n=1 Tax=Nonomuraea corallina TaxID=2989783 RepID=A0ABT4SN05_9ACTN|nr:helix-turn-helix domain-containing protein [Nonomuraea corallina]MDA0638572.1 helix-turn-helix domain-containing protein [Nonomuraea corallina]
MESRRITDMDTLKALAHPLRLKLYRALHQTRIATASHLAEQVDEAVSLVSYHLRKLAAHGVIEEAEPQSDDGRERWWRLAMPRYSIHDQDFRDAPERVAAYVAATRTAFHDHVEMYERYLDEQSAWPPEWRAAAFSSRSLPNLTAAELAQLNEELVAVVRKWQARGEAAIEAGDTEGREHVNLDMYGFPSRRP